MKGLPNIYKKDYLAEKREKQIIDNYINYEGRGFHGKLETGNSELVKWRAKGKEDFIIDQNNLFEIKRIEKRYIFDMKKEQNGFTNHYLSLLSNLLNKKPCKNYFQKRKEILKTNFDKDINFKAEAVFIPNKEKRNKPLKSAFYLTNIDYDISDNLNDKSEDENSFKKNLKGKTINLSTNVTTYQQTQNNNENEESFILKDPDDIDLQNPFTNIEHVNNLIKEYNFYKTDIKFFNLKKERHKFPEDYCKRKMFPYREEFFKVLKFRDDSFKRNLSNYFDNPTTYNRYKKNKKMMNTIV